MALGSTVAIDSSIIVIVGFGLEVTVGLGSEVPVESAREITVGIGIGVATSAKLSGVITICMIESLIISHENSITKSIASLCQAKRHCRTVRDKARPKGDCAIPSGKRIADDGALENSNA